jgi:hypothetical protein
MWPHLNLDGYREFLQDILSRGDLAPEFVRRKRRVCAIIDAMTGDERRTVLPAFAKSNIERIAFDSGVSEIEVATFLTSYVSQVQRVNYQHGTAGPWLALCARAHAKLLEGTCPWCGKWITHGNIAS